MLAWYVCVQFAVLQARPVTFIFCGGHLYEVGLQHVLTTSFWSRFDLFVVLLNSDAAPDETFDNRVFGTGSATGLRSRSRRPIVNNANPHAPEQICERSGVASCGRRSFVGDIQLKR